MNIEPERRRRIARQHLATSQLLGVDFIPVGRTASSASSDGSSGPIDSSDAARGASPVVPVAGSLFAASDPAPQSPSELAPDQKHAAWEELRARHDAQCPHCTTAGGHTRTVFGEGDADAALIFIGEAPGAEEDRTGRPFVGAAGKKLDQMIEAMGLRREQVYIANILKSRPPDNRTPLGPEIDGCSPFLAEQVRIIRPRVIVALGSPAAKFLLRTNEGITRLRGQFTTYVDGTLRIDIMPTFHPAYLLRNYTVDTRTKVWADMQAVMARLTGR